MNLIEYYWKDYVKEYILKNPDIFLLDDENRKMLYNWSNDLSDEIQNKQVNQDKQDKQDNNFEYLSSSDSDSWFLILDLNI